MTDQQVKANIGKNVKRLRGKRSQYWLANESGTYAANIARIETAESMPGAGLLFRIATALETTTDALICGPKK